MSTEVVHAPSTALTIHPEQTTFNDHQVAALQQLGVARSTPADLAVFFHQAVRTGLDPFVKQIYMIERQGKQTIQTGIDGFRLIARRAVDRSGESFGYEDTQWCGPDGQWTDVWLSKGAPAAAKATVIRNGQRFSAVALFDEYAGRKRDGGLMQMWATKGSLMLAKCAEALALRKAFPQDLSGLYTSDEMAQADAQEAEQGRPAQPRQDQNLFDPQAALREAWDNVERLTALGKWSAHQGAPEQYTHQIRDRIAELNTTETQEAEIVDEG